MFKVVFSLILFLVSYIYTEDIRITYVQHELSHLPSWCQASYLYQKPDISTLSTQVDDRGCITSVALICDGRKIDEVLCEWEIGTDIRCLTKVYIPKQSLVHIFKYDSNDCAQMHIIQGNLTGESPDLEQQYQIVTAFDEQYWPICRIEANGKKTEYFYNGTTVITESDSKAAIKRIYSFDGSVEQESIEDLSLRMQESQGKRRWKKVSTNADAFCSKEMVSIGMSEGTEEYVLRNEEYVHTEDGDGPGRIFDGEGCELFYSKNAISCSDATLMALLGNPDFDQLDDECLIPLSVCYTSRQTPSKITYTNGEEKQLRYFPDGQLRSITYPNGSKSLFEVDSFGRKLKCQYYPVGATEPIQRVYQYTGLSLVGFEDAPGYAYKITRDRFNRPVEFCQCYRDACVQKVHIACDGLERIVSLEASGKTGYQEQYSYNESGAIFRHIRYKEDGASLQSVECFNEEGKPLERRLGEISYIFDEAGRIAQIEKNGVPIVIKEYRVQDGLVEESSRFTDQGRLVEVRKSNGQLVSRTWFDGAAKVLLQESICPLDERGSAHLHQQSGSISRDIEWYIGANQRLQKIIGPNNRCSSYTYDSRNRLVAQKMSSSCTIYYEYENERLSRMYAEDGSLDYSYAYDGFGRIISIHDAIARTTVQREFDSLGRLIADGESDCSCTMSYVPSGDICSITLPDFSTILYDGASVSRSGKTAWQEPLCAAKRMQSQSKYMVDAMGQLVQEQGAVSCSYSFDPFGRPVRQMQEAVFNEDGNCIELQAHPSEKRFTYDALGRLKQCNCNGHVEEYRYDGLGRLIEIITDGISAKVIRFASLDLGSICKGKIQELRVIHPRTKELLYLEIHGSRYQAILDEHDSIVALYDTVRNCVAHKYAYNAFGECLSLERNAGRKLFCRYRFYGKRLLPLSNCYDFGPRRLHPQLQRWLEADPLGMADTVDDRIFCRNNPTLFTDPTGLFPKLASFASITGPMLASMEQMASNTYKSITFAKNSLDWLIEMRVQYEAIFFTLIGRSWLQLMGFNLDPSAEQRIGGLVELPKKARVTLINGILNGSTEARNTARAISRLHGNVPVYYVYSATQGFAGDLLRGSVYKIGVVSKQAKILIKLWRRLIKEMGGPASGGVIWHYAHSLGATDTATALTYLTAEEKSVIRVATFGAPTIIDADACAKVDNYISVHDGVPLLDPMRYISASRQDLPHVHFLPSKSMPLMDHILSGDTYFEVLSILGQQFQDEYLRS